MKRTFDPKDRFVPPVKDKLIEKDMKEYSGQQDDNVPLKKMDNQLVEMVIEAQADEQAAPAAVQQQEEALPPEAALIAFDDAAPSAQAADAAAPVPPQPAPPADPWHTRDPWSSARSPCPAAPAEPVVDRPA